MEAGSDVSRIFAALAERAERSGAARDLGVEVIDGREG
jgi:hypothetical protein